MDLSKKTARFIDNGLFTSFALNLAPAFGKFQYWTPWQCYAARSETLNVGTGYKEMERVRFLLDDADDVDLWIFPDIYYHDLQVFLEDRGARVFGARNGEEMELHRWEFKEHLKKIGLPVQHCERFFGIEPTIDYLRKNEKKYVKTSFVRGDFETFRHETWNLSEPRFAELAHHLGPLKDDYEFIIEDEIPDCVEVGYDGLTIDGQFPSHAMVAYEVKDVGMIGTARPYKLLPDPVKFVNEKLSPALKGYNYRGFLSTEIRYGKAKKPYLIDPCCRLGAPSNELLQVLFEDWPTVLWDGAEGKLTSPKVSNEFGVLAIIHSEWAVDHWQAIEFPKEIEQYVKLRFSCKKDNKHYVIPQQPGLPDIGAVVGVGKTLLEAVKHCKDNAKQVKGYGIEITLDSIDTALDAIQNGEKLGVKFTDKVLPTKEQLMKL